ncbi:MAG TPA: hypothetical protein VK939_10925 [Longimicrobiales bacterium]|nr:hypothetical protein [Longimicrobiales bacterium]
MTRPDPRTEEAARARQRIIRKASVLTVSFFAAGLVIALAGAALIALLLRFTGLPFMKTWLIVSAITVVAALAGALWSARRS